VPSRPLTCEKSAAFNRTVASSAAHLRGSSSLANANGPLLADIRDGLAELGAGGAQVLTKDEALRLIPGQ
jgi:hypothetical protein